MIVIIVITCIALQVRALASWEGTLTAKQGLAVNEPNQRHSGRTALHEACARGKHHPATPSSSRPLKK